MRLPIAALAVVLLSSQAMAAEPPIADRTAAIGDLELRFDAARWAVDGSGDRYTWAPSTLEASGVHDGIRYRFASGLTHPCGGIEGVSRDMFEALLGGTSVVLPSRP